MDSVELKCSASTDPMKLAGKIHSYVGEMVKCELSAMGCKAICVAVKSLAILSSAFKMDYSCKVFYFNNSESDVSGITFIICAV